MAIVQYMHSGQVGAPQMAKAKGQILQVLDACLITGFGQKTAVGAEIRGNRVLIDFGSTHGFGKLQYILISGAEDNNLNGVKRILECSNNTVTIELGNVTNTTGTITAQVAPVGWESIFGTTDPYKRAYRSKNLNGTRTVVYLDANLYDTGYSSSSPIAKVRVDLCRDMIFLGDQIDSYTKAVNDKYKDGYYHFFQSTTTTTKSGSITADNRNWVLIGDENFIYFLVEPFKTASETYRQVYYFGDIPPISPNDKFNFVLGCPSFDISNKNLLLVNDIIYNVATGQYNKVGGFITGKFNDSIVRGYFIRDVSGVANTPPLLLNTCAGVSTSLSGIGGEKYPNPLTFGLSGHPVRIVDSSTPCTRGFLPFLNFIPETITNLSMDLVLVGNNIILSTGDGLTDATYYSGEYPRNNCFLLFNLGE